MALSKGTLFAPETVNDLFNKVRGFSSVAALNGGMPVAFNGSDVFTFSLDSEVDIVAENGAKSEGGATVAVKRVVPLKLEYGARVSDEFMYASEEKQLDILRAFNEGAARKIARGLDLMAFHGINPRTGSLATATIGNNYIVKAAEDNAVVYNASTPDANIEAAVAMLDTSDADVTGIAMSKTVRSALAAETNNNGKLYPELAWGGNASTINGVPVSINSTVSNTTDKLEAVVGDFANAFKWGIAKEIPLEVIEYGDPDNTGNDLKGHNQVYLRVEIFVGWAILDEDAFAIVKGATTSA